MSVAELEAHEVALESATGGLWRDAFRRLVRNPAAILGALLVAMFIVAAAFAPLLAPYAPKDQNLLLHQKLLALRQHKHATESTPAQP